MAEFKDQTGRIVVLKKFPPARIISLVPSQTELLHYLGMEDEVIGITKFCIHPQNWFRNKTKIGGTKNIDLRKIVRLHPDLIIANKEENAKDQVEELEKIAPVWVSNINTYRDALNMIESVGQLLGKQKNAATLIAQIDKAFSKLQTANYKLKTAYLIWNNPYMAAGGDTFINDMLQKCGLQNVFENESRYPCITAESITANGTELILLSSEPFPFKRKHVEELKLQLTGFNFPLPKILIADGEMFSWYGSRMLYAAQYLSELINHIYKPPADNSTIG